MLGNVLGDVRYSDSDCGGDFPENGLYDDDSCHVRLYVGGCLRRPLFSDIGYDDHVLSRGTVSASEPCYDIASVYHAGGERFRPLLCAGGDSEKSLGASYRRSGSAFCSLDGNQAAAGGKSGKEQKSLAR